MLFVPFTTKQEKKKKKKKKRTFLTYKRYAVIPLSPNSGLIGWVPHSDTLHTLIKDYRESRKVLLNIEYRLMLQVCFELFFALRCELRWSYRWRPTTRA